MTSASDWIELASPRRLPHVRQDLIQCSRPSQPGFGCVCVVNADRLHDLGVLVRSASRAAVAGAYMAHAFTRGLQSVEDLPSRCLARSEAMERGNLRQIA
jgi:hypothetical protein